MGYLKILNSQEQEDIDVVANARLYSKYLLVDTRL